jgi:putative oxidoreductase
MTSHTYPAAGRSDTVRHGAATETIRSSIGVLERMPSSLLTLLLRLGVASVFLKSGLTKIDASWQVTDITISLFENEYRVPLLPPDLAAYMATAFELGCSVLLIVGLFSRLAALPLLGMTIVIQTFVYPGNWSEHLIWAAILLLILTRGPGRISLDYLIGRRLIEA